MRSPTPTRQALYIFSGLPGSGKSTLAQALAESLGAAFLRVDTVEQALRDLCALDVQGEGYRLTYRVAADNLRLGLSVVADSCNPIDLTRREWERVARNLGVPYVNIEVVCSDEQEHRGRVESRLSEVPRLKLPSWTEVQGREYHEWVVERLVIDTAGKTVADSTRELIAKVEEWAAPLPGVLAELIKREPLFHREEFGRTRDDFEAMTEPEFCEVGASGRHYSRQYVIDGLVRRYKGRYDDVWETCDFRCIELGPTTFLLTYTLLQGAEKDRVTRRATIWRRRDEKWTVVYHQGTIVEDR